MKKVFINIWRDKDGKEYDGILRFPSERAAKEIGMFPSGHDGPVYVRTEEREVENDE